MLKKLIELNPGIEFYDVNDGEFSTFGRVIRDLDVSEIIETAKKIPNPASGSEYIPSVAEFEKLPIASEIGERFFGTLPAQVGYCFGYNSFLDATEWHFSSEINVAVTPLVLILGHVWDVKDRSIDSSKFKAFFVPRGMAVEVYATTLHYCPCEVEKNGFGWVVALPLDTNTDLAAPVSDPLLFSRNKWLIAHCENKSLIDDGAVAGVTGTNFKIKYS